MSLSTTLSTLRLVSRIYTKSPSTIFSLIVITLYTVGALATVLGLVPPLPPAKGGWEYIYQPPSARDFPWYILGTDFTGRPLLLAIVRGISTTLAVAFLSAVITVTIGVALGLISGYLGGIVDEIFSIIINVALTIPTYLLALILVATLPAELKTNILVLAGILSITAWASLARAVRAQTLSLRKREFIDVAKTLGFSAWKIMFDEILRFMAPFIAMSLTLAMCNAVYGYTGLAFLGLMPISSENWGIQIYMAIRAGGALYSDRAILALWSPIITIVLLQYALINIAKTMEAIFNPALRVSYIKGE
ncbi:MAG: ABC transporter permease [Ignisphaera sp.]|uniref:ABC transporter permease n=1 Tax=Ignisphaera aggregans TaxID=334771 RepID=A0A7J3I6Q0_9CREN